jgi:beta-N-acetylhexosaminidase
MNPGPILIGLPGTELDDASRVNLSHPAVGGVVLFSRNFEDREQLLRLVGDIRSLRDPRLLVCVDQEGGRVQRLQDGFTRLPPLGVLGKLYQSDSQKALDMAYRHGRVMATEMLACGIDISFAPVLDLNRGSCVIGDRSFSDDPGVVVRLGRSYLAGMHDSGMRTTGKHFPGHGSILADSHVDDVVDPRKLAQLLDTDLVPFRDLSCDLDALMIAHVIYPDVDTLPAGYSEPWLSEILKGSMNYRGAVISDDLGMHAAKSVGGIVERTLRCLAAGCDLVLVCLPEDVKRLLSEWDAAVPDAGTIISSLYGQPTISAQELESTGREGIKEWRQWRLSLEQLGAQSWI